MSASRLTSACTASPPTSSATASTAGRLTSARTRPRGCSVAKRCATARPMPLPAPVMAILRSVSSMDRLTLFEVEAGFNYRGRMASELPARSGRPPVSARGARTRDALVKAGREVFERDGFLDARITDITATAGVAAGSFYTYFKSKEDVFAAVMDDVNEEMLHPRLREFADRDDPVSVIEATNRSYLVAYRRNARLMALMEQVAQIDDDFRRIRLRRVRAFTERNA